MLVVADFGSGTGGLKNIIGNHKHLKELKGFGHVSVDSPRISAKEMSKIGLEEGSVEILVMCVSLSWGSNWEDF
jgi:hypothetical protein